MALVVVMMMGPVVAIMLIIRCTDSLFLLSVPNVLVVLTSHSRFRARSSHFPNLHELGDLVINKASN